MSTQPLPIWGPNAGRTLRLDCRHFRGDRPCAAEIQGICPPNCSSYAAMGHRIVIIKLGALGDVIRTAALLGGLKQQWPESHITWVTRPGAVRMLTNHPDIDRLLAFDAETICHLEHEHFDLCLSLDKEPGPTALAMRLDARERRGIGLSRHGTIFPLNEECGEYFRLGLDDDYKFNVNQQSYQALLYAAVGLEYNGQRYRLYPRPSDRRMAHDFWASHGLDNQRPVIGLNTGAGHVFVNKTWSAEQFRIAIQRLQKDPEVRIALFGGPDERERNDWLAAVCPGLINTGSNHHELTFAALIERCSVLLTGDTMAMHVAIAADVPVVALFGPTCHQEIDLFGHGEKLISSLACSPCYARSCDVCPSCMDSHAINDVVQVLQRYAKSETKPSPEREEAHAT